MTDTITNEQLEAWAGCTAKYPEPTTLEMWNERVALFAEAKLHAPKLAATLLAERKAREVDVGELRAALSRMLLEFDFMIEANMISDVRNDVIFVEARAALAKMEESK